MKHVLVIGGGITGLSVMYELQKWKKERKSDVKLTLAESNSVLGGKIQTVKNTGFIMEAGADSIVTRKMKGFPYIEELGLEEEVVYNAAGTSFLYRDHELKQIPADAVFGIPTSIESLAKSELVSAEGKVRALKDLYTKNETFTENDSVGAFLECFFGKELVEKQIAPVLSGVYSGKLSELTIASTLPYLLDYKNQYGSIIKGLEANKDKFLSNNDKKFLSFKNGLESLIDGFERSFNQAEVLLNKQVRKIDRKGAGYLVFFQNGDTMEVDQLVLAIPHEQAAKLFDDTQLAERFRPFRSSSLISIYMGFDIPDDVLPEEGTGFIATDSADISCNACTWTSKKWKHTSETGNLLVRMFYKSNLENFSSLQLMDEQELLHHAQADVSKALGVTSEPITSNVTKWMDNMPKYQLTHPQDIKQLEQELEERYPGIWIAGCSYYGVGIPDCIDNGKQIAAKVIEWCQAPVVDK